MHPKVFLCWIIIIIQQLIRRRNMSVKSLQGCRCRSCRNPLYFRASGPAQCMLAYIPWKPAIKTVATLLPFSMKSKKRKSTVNGQQWFVVDNQSHHLYNMTSSLQSRKETEVQQNERNEVKPKLFTTHIDVMLPVCGCVCLSVCQCDNLWTLSDIIMKFLF